MQSSAEGVGFPLFSCIGGDRLGMKRKLQAKMKIKSRSEEYRKGHRHHGVNAVDKHSKQMDSINQCLWSFTGHHRFFHKGGEIMGLLY